MARYNSVNATGSITGGNTITTPASGLLTTITSSGNTTVPNPVLYAGSTQVFYNASGVGINLLTPSGNFVGPSASGTGTIGLVNGGVITLTSDGANYIVTDFQGGPISGTSLTATGAVTLNPAGSSISLQPTGSGASVTIAPGTTAGSIDNMNIGATTKGSGAFTSLTTTGAVTLTSTGAASAYNTSGASLLVSGGVGIAGNLYANAIVGLTGATAVTLGTAASGTLQVTGGVGISGAVYSAGEARHDGKVTFGSGNAYLNSSAGDNFTLSTKTNTPNPNFNINIGDGTASGYSKNPIFWNGFLAFSGNGKADTGTPDVKIDGSGNLAIGTASPIRRLHLNAGEFSITPSGTTAFLNLSDVSGNSGASYNLNIRGLDTGGSVGATLASITLGASAIYTPGVIYNNSSRPILKQSGSILQVQSTSYGGTFTSTSTSYVDVGLSVSITPSTTSSKILVMANIMAGSTPYNVLVAWRFVRDSTAIGLGNSTSGYTQTTMGNMRDSFDANSAFCVPMQYLDSPGLTSAITYKVQAFCESGTFRLNGSGNDTGSIIWSTRGISTITVMEIAG
jgi:hypothetical protein